MKDIFEFYKPHTEEQKDLLDCVSKWKYPANCWDTFVKHKYLFDYYPWKEYHNDISELEKLYRSTIWSYKNSAIRNTPEEYHNTAENLAVRFVVDTLTSTFGKLVSKLTFVCIPASTQLDTERRLASFASRICEETGMENAFNHIKVSKDGESHHNGGTKTHEIWHDEIFFKGKSVVLFDDVRTTGSSLNKESNELEKMGACVICSLSLGQSVSETRVCHTRKADVEAEYKHEYVDLGLSVKWATCNIGAESPCDCGDYYSWGERDGIEYNREDFIWKEPQELFEKGIVDENWDLLPEYDIATRKWGGRWRMPTHCEIEELKRFCKCEWIERKGEIDVCKVIGPNGNHIYLPACGASPDITSYCMMGMYWGATAIPLLGSQAEDTGSAFALKIVIPDLPFCPEKQNRTSTYCVRPVIEL